MSWSITLRSRLEKSWSTFNGNIPRWMSEFGKILSVLRTMHRWNQLNFKKWQVNSWIFFTHHLVHIFNLIIPSWTGTWLIQCCVLEKPIETPVRAILGVRHHSMSRFIVIWIFGLSPIGLDELFPLGVSISCTTILSTGEAKYTRALQACG